MATAAAGPRGRRPARSSAVEPGAGPEAVARDAGLRYVNDESPGIRRLKSGRSFRYVDSDGRAVRDPETLARIKALVIPPAWTDVWICPRADGHIQATGVGSNTDTTRGGGACGTRPSSAGRSPSAGRCPRSDAPPHAT